MGKFLNGIRLDSHKRYSGKSVPQGGGKGWLSAKNLRDEDRDGREVSYFHYRTLVSSVNPPQLGFRHFRKSQELQPLKKRVPYLDLPSASLRECSAMLQTGYLDVVLRYLRSSWNLSQK